MTPLARPLGEHSVVGASTRSSLVAVGLEDGSIDLLDPSGRRRTLPPEEKPFELRELVFSPDDSILAVTRASATWKGETTFYETATGKRLGTIEGRNVFFDPTSRFVAGQGGVSRVADGQAISHFKEGFWVEIDAGKFGPIETSHGEVFAGDYAARGFFEGKAFYASSQAVEVVELETGSVTRLPASCGKAGAKAVNRADPAHGRMIAVCNDAVLVTDLATRTTKRIPAAIQKTHTLFPPQVLAPADTTDIVVWTLNREDHAFLIDGSTAKAIGPDVWNDFSRRDGPDACAITQQRHSDVACPFPALRPDGRFRLELRRGVIVTDAAGKPVIDWSTRPVHDFNGPDYEWASINGSRVVRDRKTHVPSLSLDAAATAGAPISSDGCGRAPKSWDGTYPWYLHESDDSHALYTGYLGTKDRSTGTLVCLCTTQGCTRTTLNGVEESVVSGRADGTLLTSKSTDNYATSTLTLRRANQRPIVGKIPIHCLDSVLTPAGRVFASCGFLGQRRFIFELSPADLSILAKRPTPPVASSLQLLGDELLVGTMTDGVLLPFDWVKDPNVADRGELFATGTSAIAVQADGKVKLAGDLEIARKILRCYDGERLRPFDTCRDAVVTR